LYCTGLLLACQIKSKIYKGKISFNPIKANYIHMKSLSQKSVSVFIKSCLILAVWFGILPKSYGQAWLQKANYGGGMTGSPVGFSIGTKGYIATGSSGSPKNDLWEYDQSLNTWTQKANFPGAARFWAVGFSIGNYGYVGTGAANFGGPYYNDFYQYDPSANTWTPKANFGGVARGEAVGASIGAKGYLGMGSNGSSKTDFWEYDPSVDTWTQKANFIGTARYGMTAFTINNYGYFGTGNDAVNGYKQDFYKYDPSGDTWTQLSNFPGQARHSSSGFAIGNYGYMGTGQTGNGIVSSDFWRYDPVLDTWLQLTSVGGSIRANAVGFSIGSKGYIGTGYNVSGFLQDLWEYTPALSGIDELTDEKLDINLFPNPASDDLYIKSVKSSPGKTEFNIVDCDGKVVLKKTIPPFNSSELIHLDISGLVSGTYILNISIGNLRAQKQFVKLVK
jgi:N-acetylneuraminic acid mutarotase